MIDDQTQHQPQKSTVLINRLVIIAQKKMKSIVFIPFLVSAMTRCNAFTFTARYPKVSSRRSSSSSSLIAASSSSTQSDIIHIGLIGGGTVGGGICEILEKKQAYLTSLTGKSLHVKSICVRDVSKPRDFTIPPGCQVHTDPQIILSDPEIDIVVEVMGGTTLAKDLVFQALSKGKHVVTANKALIANCLSEIEHHVVNLNQQQGDDKTQFKYEAAVCGGIPIINSLLSDYPGDDITMLAGIINGCTNFMLTAMDRDGLSYDQALAEASKLGYAEADPTLDVGGFDARSKLKILMRLAYGLDVDENDIAVRGITELTKDDYDYAKKLGGTIKLLGVAEKVGSNKVSGFVSPCYVTSSDSLSSVSDATNAVEISSANLKRTIYIGQGAGRFPTANSCVNDIVSIAKGHRTLSPFNPSSKDSVFVQSFESVFYIRLKYRDQLGITRQCGEICERNGVSIHSILQNPVTKKSNAAFVLITERVASTNIKKAIAELEALDWVQGPVFFMPVLRPDWM